MRSRSPAERHGQKPREHLGWGRIRLFAISHSAELLLFLAMRSCPSWSSPASKPISFAEAKPHEPPGSGAASPK